MRKKIAALVLAGAFALSVPAAASADNPHAGQSGHFKGSTKQCKDLDSHPKCPPFGG
jgi:hypothetical protein